MIKVENIDVWGFEHAIRGMRNPLNSWDKSDSRRHSHPPNDWIIGPKDLDLMKRLYKAGPEHRTYARMIQVSMDITAPLYWWKEMDRYTVGKSQVSTSTMHKIAAKEFEYEDFSHEHLETSGRWLLGETIRLLNKWREVYINGNPVYAKGDKKIWWQMIQSLPSSYNQKRTVMMSYEVVFKILHERSNHKLDEWREFCDILKSLPYIKEITEDDNESS